MSQNSTPDALRVKTLRKMLSEPEIAFLDAMGWRDDGAPVIASQAQADCAAAIERKLNGAVAQLSYSERGASLEGRLSATLGARLADWRERDDDEL